MYSIGEVAERAGISPYTLRYYEKIGVLPKPDRQGGVRRYDEQDLRYILFVHGLKQTGMSLEKITAFTKEGCLLDLTEQDTDIEGTIERRTELLRKHIEHLDEQIKQLEAIKTIAEEKCALYVNMREERRLGKTERTSPEAGQANAR